MEDVALPEWIKDIRDTDEAERSTADLRASKALLADSAIKRDGPVFFREFTAALALNASALEAIGLHGEAFNAGREKDPEMYWKVIVERHSQSPRSKSMNVFYAPGEDSIRTYTPDDRHIGGGVPKKLVFCVGPQGQIGVVSPGVPRDSTAASAARLLIEEMVRAIRRN